MERERFLQCLAADEARLRAVAARDLTRPVPSCPDWTVEDLVRHVAVVYAHKTECMRRNAMPDPWPPDTSGEPALALLDRAYAELTGEFADRKSDSPAATWYEPDQTAGFWIRRMAQETVIHRVDAELALGEPVAPIPDDLADDGIDEVLRIFLAYASTQWREYFAPLLTPGGSESVLADQAVLIDSGERRWLVRPEATGVYVEPAGEGAAAAARVVGTPQDVLLWLWRRRGDDAVTVHGDPAAADLLYALLEPATQ